MSRQGLYVVGGALVLALTWLCGAAVAAANIKLGYAALSAGQVSAWMAKEGGYLSKYGIEAELIYIPAVAATQALIAGEIQLAQVTGVSTAGAILAGADVKIIASSLNRLVGFIYARPEIKSPEQLKGKKLGISRFGALSDTAAAIFLERHGLKRGTDVAIIQLGGLPEIVTAMDKGLIEAGFASPPNSSRVKRLGMRELFDIDAYAPRVEKIPYPTLKGIKFILDEMAERQPQARKTAPESFVDLSLLQEIEQSGFFKQLWKN